MKLPPFTLVYRPHLRTAERKARRQRLVADLSDHAGGLPFSLNAIKPTIRRSLLDTVVPSADSAGSVEFLSRAVDELRRQAKVTTVGFWDLTAQVGELPRVVAALNRAQPVFAFFEVQAAVPSGLISRPQRVIAWAKELLDSPLSDQEEAEIGNNLIFEDFAERARRVRRELGIDYLVGIAPSMIAFEEGDSLYWNYFSMYEARLLLVSTLDVFTFARKANRPFEVAVAGLALSTLLAELNPDLGFHEEIRGCLFDFNRERATLVESLRRAEIEPDCLKKIRPKYRAAAAAMVEALRELTTSPASSDPGERTTGAVSKRSSSGKPDARPKTRGARE